MILMQYMIVMPGCLNNHILPLSNGFVKGTPASFGREPMHASPQIRNNQRAPAVRATGTKPRRFFIVTITTHGTWLTVYGDEKDEAGCRSIRPYQRGGLTAAGLATLPRPGLIVTFSVLAISRQRQR